MKTPSSDRRPDEQAPAPGESQLNASESLSSDADITRPAALDAAVGIALDVQRLRVGAAVYGSDGIEAAIVELVQSDVVSVRAGSPGRPVDVPLNAIQRVSDDGNRLDLRLTSEEVERLSGENEPGYAHLAAQRPDDLAAHDVPERGDQSAES
jgi:hypothetical protein